MNSRLSAGAWRLVTALALVAGLARPSWSATVVATVRDRDGALLDRIGVTVLPSSDDARANPRLGRSSWRGWTDLSGSVRIENVPEGSYVVDATDLPRGEAFVMPRHNPRAPPPAITVRGAADVIPVALELWRGSLVQVTLSANRRAPHLSVNLLPREGVDPQVVRLSEDGLVVQTIVMPGRWTVVPQVPEGWLLTDILVEGESAPAADAVIDVSDRSATGTRVEIVVVGMAELGGSLNLAGDTFCPVEGVLLTLLEPGPWFEAARQRGGSTFNVVKASISGRTCEWNAIVPSGRWRIDVVCADGCVVDPAGPQVIIGPGEYERVDFNGIVPSGSGKHAATRAVLVTDSEGKPAARARIEAPAPGGRPSTPVRADDQGRAMVRVPAAGGFRIVAGHGDHLDAETTIEPGGAGGGKPPGPVAIALRPAARVAVSASDSESAPLAGVVVAFKALTEPDDLLVEPLMRRWRRERTDSTGADGKLLWPGLHSGEAVLVARLAGADADRFIVDVREGGADAAPDPRDDDPARLLLDLETGVTKDVRIRVRPAARVAISLDPRCDDLPREVEVVAVPASRLQDAGDEVEPLLSEPTLRLPRLPRTGPGQLGVEAGPLETGRWIVAVKPDGFARWTFFPGSEVVEDIEPIEAIAGEVAVAESVDVDCDPLALLAVGVLAGGPGPDLRLADVAATYLPAHDGGTPVTVKTRRLRTRVRLEHLPVGSGRLHIVLRHPHVLPEPELAVERDVTLVRAGLVRLEGQVAALGGALRVGTGAPFGAARRREQARPARIEPAREGLVLLPSLEPGEWIVEDCADAACAEILRERVAVVEVGKTANVPGD